MLLPGLTRARDKAKMLSCLTRLKQVGVTCPAMGHIEAAAWYFREPHMGSPLNPFPNPGAGWDSAAAQYWQPRAQNFMFLDGSAFGEVR